MERKSGLIIEEEALGRIKLVCSDIDGTLVEEGKSGLNPEYYDQIRRLKEKGIRFVVISGRSYEGVRPLFEPVQEDILFINDNGAAVHYRGELIRRHVMPFSLAREILTETSRIPHCGVYVSVIGGCYSLKGNPDFCRLLLEDFDLEVRQVERFPEDIPEDAGVMSIGLYHNVDVVQAVGREFIEKWADHGEIFAVPAGNKWFNFGQKQVNKGSALAEALEEYGIQKEEALAFGDNMNDFSMLSLIPNSVAVGNARQEIKDICRYLTDTNVNDGVLKVLRQL